MPYQDIKRCCHKNKQLISLSSYTLHCDIDIIQHYSWPPFAELHCVPKTAEDAERVVFAVPSLYPVHLHPCKINKTRLPTRLHHNRRPPCWMLTGMWLAYHEYSCELRQRAATRVVWVPLHSRTVYMAPCALVKVLPLSFPVGLPSVLFTATCMWPLCPSSHRTYCQTPSLDLGSLAATPCAWNTLIIYAFLSFTRQESRAAARKPRDAASVLFGWSSPTTFLTSIRLAVLRKPRLRAPNMLAQNTI